MPIPRDTLVLRELIILCYESVGNCQTLSKDGTSHLVNNIIFRRFFFSLRQVALVSCLFLHLFDVHPTRVLYIVLMFIKRQLFISRDIQLYYCIFSFLRKK